MQPQEPVSETEAVNTQPQEQSDREAHPVDAEQPPRLSFPVIGIGASAGGLEAVSDLLSGIRGDSGMAFVFVQHLPPGGESMLVEILAKRTLIPVHEVKNGMDVEPNHLYVIRPGHTLTIGNGKFHLGERLARPMHNRPVDDFFKSLAQEQRQRAIGVVMSGMGSNGSAGAQSIKAVGGICIAQDPETAQFPSMPQHLIDAGYADYVLRPQDIGDVLLAYAGHPYAQGVPDTKAGLAKRDQQHVREILAVLRTRTRRDFNGYKKQTVLRRIHRRMGLNRLTSIGEYAKLFRQSTSEVTALADDLLIHVTGFFRDPEAWETLRQQIIVPLIESRKPDETIRGWVTACASGEEAYTLAMLLVEEAERINKPLDIKVFATDMAERTLLNARSGVYPGGIEAEIEPRRLERFFQREDAIFRVRQDLRERVVFAPQDLLQDPPFSRLDIVSCRNLLIYLEPEMQKHVLSLLHFGLREGGALFLGNNETATNDELFEPIDKRARLYRRVGPTRHGEIDFPLPHAIAGANWSERGNTETRTAALRPSLAQMSSRALLEHHTAPAVTIDRDRRIVYYHGNTEPFISAPRGEPTRDLMELVRENVRGAVRSALQRAASGERIVTVPDGWIEIEPGRRVRIAVTASSLDSRNAPDYMVVSFHERGDQQEENAATGSPADAADTSRELRRAQDELQSTIEELQTRHEELKASHEEVVSINEELQSSSEELETTREEMQSLNEELTTVNTQLQAKIEEHKAARNDLASLLTSTNIAVLFLDTELRIRRFTPQVRELFEMLESDVGRPLSDLAKKFTDPGLKTDAEKVLNTLVPIEKEIAAENDRWFLRRLTPYRTADNRIDGVVASFVEITARLKVEAALRASEEQFRLQYGRTVEILESISDAFYAVDAGFNFTYVNRKAELLWDRRRVDLIGKNLWTELPEAVGSVPYELQAQVMKQRKAAQAEVMSPTIGRWIDMSVYPEAGGGLSCYFRDITERKQAEEALRASEERFRLLVDGASDFAMMMVDPAGLITAWNDGAQRLLGYSAAEALGMDAAVIFTPEDRAQGAPQRELAHAKANGRARDERWHLRKDGARFWGSGVLTSLRHSDGTLRGFVKVLRDETAAKKSQDMLRASKAAAEEASHAKDEFLAVLSHELRTPLSAILLWAKILDDSDKPTEAQLREGLSAIKNSAEAQKELIEDLLDVSRITSGQLRLQMREIELLPMVREAVDAIAPTAEAKGVNLKADLDSDAGIVRADPGRLRQVVWNLLTNAVKFTPARGNVSVTLRRADGEVEIRVSDTGRGIRADFLPHVFERFRQVEASSTRTQGGMGLGLTIAKQLAELHGGTIVAESRGLNQGATFIVRLPLAEVSAKPPVGKQTPARQKTKIDRSILSGRTVLLVEDDRTTRQALATLLRKNGVAVLEAESAATALESFRKTRPDLIVSDIGMPDEDGYALIRRIRQLESETKTPPVPAMALTAFARDIDRQQALKAGFQQHVSKPVEPDQMLAAMVELLQEKQS